MTNTANANKFGLITRIVAITLVITPPSGRGLVIPIFFRGFFFFLVVICPRPPVFARPKKYPPCFSPHNQGLLFLVAVTIFSPPRGGGGRRTAGSNAPGAFLVYVYGANGLH